MVEIAHHDDGWIWSEEVPISHPMNGAVVVMTQHNYNASECGVVIQRGDETMGVWWDTGDPQSTLQDLDTLVEVIQRLRNRIAETEL